MKSALISNWVIGLCNNLGYALFLHLCYKNKHRQHFNLMVLKKQTVISSMMLTFFYRKRGLNYMVIYMNNKKRIIWYLSLIHI